VLKEISMLQAQHFAVIIIGTGAGSGTLAYALAPSGKRILLLDRGNYVPRKKDKWSPRAVNVDGKYQTNEVWRDQVGGRPWPEGNVCHTREEEY
jgi:choline dehydrogenase-like flavoprotein